ncbi:uncharacterized protein LOC108426524 isoform X3 [Pygocentrus nattereri]|uniref:uncharacterized protein LOC108426524 isoform X3 n=1 Tax=Pygocentrus nattereri TaxID=42514 RepID=UPI001891C304|nr:uncharacterized protein LOC108426524 isoform X3 [Pygocentrus nattereri]
MSTKQIVKWELALRREPQISQEDQMKTENIMKPCQLTCQNCDRQYETIKDFKVHVRSYSHKQEVAVLFQRAVHRGQTFFPMFVVMDYLRTPKQRHPLIGLDMVTVCITPEKYGAFYLCHICEERLSSQDINKHLSSTEHYFKFLAHSNPELLRFAWFKDSFLYLQSSALKENSTNGSGTLRFLELPKMMLKRGKKLAYHQVMMMFSKTKKLTERVSANRPQRKTLQAYITDPARTNPLLGMNFLVEYSCPDSEHHCGYLCILCKKKLQAIDGISHCISFDHVYWYLQEAHPATLECPKSSYTHYSYNFHEKIFYLANQAQKKCPPGEVQSVHLDLSGFKDIDSSSYMNALDKLQLIRQERNQSEIKASVTPGERIIYTPETPVSSASMVTTICSAEQEAEKTHKDSATENGDSSHQFILCVECNKTLPFISDYKMHIKGREHKEKLVDLFGTGLYAGPISVITLYQYLWSKHLKNSSPPLMGLQLLTVLVDRQSQWSSSPLYLCHACEMSISTSASTHLTSTQHYLNVFAHTKPDYVFLGARDLNKITKLAKEEEERQRKEKMVLRICEIPRNLWRKFKSLAFEKIMATIWNHHPKLSNCIEVPKRVTLQSYAKSCDRKSPLLGLQFMVKYSTTQPYPKCGYLCLLCEGKLSEMNVIAHMLSFGHVFNYLNVVHPSSLSKDDDDQMSLIVHLAEQAETIHPNGALQEVELDFGKFHKLDTNPFKAALEALQLFCREKGLGELKPSLVPGAKLVSSLEKKSPLPGVQEGCLSTPPETQQINLDATCIETSFSKTDLNFSDFLPKLKEPLKSTDHANSASTCLQPSKPSSPTLPPLLLPEASLKTQQHDPMELDTEPLSQAMPPNHSPAEAIESCQSPKPPETQDSSFAKQQSKLAQNKGDLSKASQKRKQAFIHLNKAQAVPQIPHSGNELWNYLKMANREPVIGLNSVIECHTDGLPPFYVCVSCTKRVKENSVISHLTSRDHQIMYLNSIKYAPLLAKRKVKTKWLRNQAIMFEKTEGYGEAKVLELDVQDYHQIFDAPILTGLRKLRDFLLKLTSEISDQSTMPASSSDDSRCNERPETLKSIKEEEDSPCGHLRGKAMSDDSKSDTTLKQYSDDEPLRSSPHLWSYLTSSSRTEPVIGLNVVTEYRSSSGQNSFLCSSCKVILPTSKYMCHLISPRHRFTYIKANHTKLVEQWKDTIDLTYKIQELQEKAKIVQDSEGWGQIKVVEKESPKLKEQAAQNAENPVKAHEAEPPQTSSETVHTVQQGHTKRRKSLKQLKKKKINKDSASIGLNFITCVTHDRKKLFFCELCSVRCHLDHMSSVTHRKTCVEHRYPGWTESDANMERMNEIVLCLAAVERSTGIGMKKLKVPADVFRALRTAPISEALSQLKLQQTKLKAGVELRGGHASPESSTSTAMDSTHASCSLQQEQSPILEASVIPDDMSDPLSGSHSGPIPLDPCFVSSFSVSSDRPLGTPCDTSSPNLHTPVPSAPPSILTSPVPLPPLPPPVSDLPPLPPLPHSFPDQPPLPPPIPDFPLLSSQPVTSSQSLSSPPPLYEPIAPPSLYKPNSPPPLYEPISSPAAAESRATPYIASPYSPPSTACYQISPSSISLLPHSRSHPMEGEDHADVCRGEESRLLVTASPHMDIFQNLPTVVGQSNAYMFLNLRNLPSTEPIIGLSNIVECRTTARPTLFLCLNCAVKFSTKNICCHMTSEQHQYSSIRIRYPVIFQQWQTRQNLTVRDLAKKLASEERGLDAKVIKLDHKQYDSLQSADYLSAIEILQRMYGPEQGQSSLPLHLTGQTPRARLQQYHVETDRETHRHQPQQNCVLSPSQTQHGVHNSQVTDRAFDGMQGNLNRSTEMSRLTRDQLYQHNQSPQETRKSPEMAEAQQTQHQFNSQPGLAAEFESKNTGLHSPETHTESTPETPGCANSHVSQTPELTGKGLQQITAQTSSCMISIKQEKPDYDEVSPGTCSFAVHIAPSSEAPSSREATGNPFKHTADLKGYLSSKRAVSDAVVGLRSVIVCQSEGQAPLYLCVSCSSKLSHDLIINHLLKPGHRECYLRRRYPWLCEDWSDSDSRTQRSAMLMRLAHQVEKNFEGEPGWLQEIEVQCAVLKEIKSLSFDKAITQLQKIRKEQRLCALLTCVSPKTQTVLVKQENIETEVTMQHSPQLADLPEIIVQRPKTASKRRAAVPDSPHESPPLVKQIKLSSAVTSSQKTLEQNKPWTSDHQIPSLLSPHTPKNSAQITTTTVAFSKESSPQNYANTQQNPRHFQSDSSHVSVPSSEASTPRPNVQYSCLTLKPTISNKPSQKSSLQTNSVDKTKPKSSISDTHKARLAAADPRLVANTSSDCSEQSRSVISKTCLKRQYSESKALSSLSSTLSTDEPPSHLRQSPLECPAKRRCSDEGLDNLSQVQKENSILSTALSDRSQFSHLNASRSSDPSTHTERAISNQPLLSSKNSDGQALSSPNLPPQQELPCPTTGSISVPSMKTQGQEIARLHERPLVKKRSTENAWNYENRQFSSDTLNTKLEAALSGEADWKVPANDADILTFAGVDNTAMSYMVPAHNASASSYFSTASGCGETASVTSPVIPGYATPYPYFGYNQADYTPASVTYSGIAHNYTVAADKSGVNAQSAAAGTPTNVRYFTDNNSAYASQLVYQSQKVYQALHAFQSPEAYQAYYAFSAYNQAHQPNQATAFSGNVSSASSVHGHMPAK